MPKFWKQEEIQIILDSKSRRIKIPGRSKNSIHRKMVELGLIEPKYKVKKHSKKRWTAEELKVLLETKDKLSIKLPGRTRYSILSKLGHLNLGEKQKPRKPWLKKENALLKKLVKQGKSAKEIFLMNVLPYSKNSIQKKMCFLGLTKKQKNSQYFSKDTKELFIKFLQDNWSGKTPEDLLDLWNEKNTFKVNKRKIIYYLTKLKIKIPYGEVARIKRLRKKEELLKESAQESLISLKDLSESLRLSRAEIMGKRMLQNRDIWTGLPLSHELLAKIETD